MDSHLARPAWVLPLVDSILAALKGTALLTTVNIKWEVSPARSKLTTTEQAWVANTITEEVAVAQLVDLSMTQDNHRRIRTMAIIKVSILMA